MKKILKCAFLLLLFQVLGGCEKKDVATEVVESKSKVRTEVADVESISSTQDERIKKAKEYDEYIKQKQLEIREQEKIHQKNMPYYATSEDLNKNQISSRYIKSYFEKLSDGEVAEFSPIPVTDIVRGERFCTCKFKIKTFGGNELEYKATLKRDPYREEFNDRTKHHEKDYYEFDPDAYYLVEMELLSDIESPKITNNFLNPQIKYMSDYVDDKERLVKLFEDYENEHYPIFYGEADVKVSKQQVIDYVKVNVTGSEYDEYLVWYNAPKNYVKRFKCLVVDNYSVIKDYVIPLDVTSNLNANMIYGFKKCFTIFDYNQDGINEIYYMFDIALGDDWFYCIEFSNDIFQINVLYDAIPSITYSKYKNTYGSYNEPVSAISFDYDECLISFECLEYGFVNHYWVLNVADGEEEHFAVGYLYNEVEINLRYSHERDQWVLSKYICKEKY